MIVNEENTKTIIKNMWAEGDQSRADYMEMLADKNRQLEARIARLESQLIEVLAYGDNVSEKHLKSAQAALDETQQQSLAEIQADAIEKMISVESCLGRLYDRSKGVFVFAADAIMYADKLRQQANGGSNA